MRQLPSARVLTEYVAFNGGLDTATPALNLPASFCRRAQNYEQDINGGYRRIDGYEKFDGQASPSDATYYILSANMGFTASSGTVITDVTGTSFTGTVVTDQNSTGAVSIVMTKLTGSWPSSGSIYFSTDLGTIVGTILAAPVADSASTPLLNAQYKNYAADIYRADIKEVGASVVTMTSANPGVVTWVNHGLSKGGPVKFTTTGALPTNIVAGTTYYVYGGTDSVVGGAHITANTFKVTTDSGGAGTPIDTSAGITSGVHTCSTATGTVLGVWVYGDNVYAARNAIGSSVARLYKATTAGWTAVRLYRQVSFTAASGTLEDNQTLTQTTGSEAATILRVVIEGGSLTAGDAYGRLIITQPQVGGTDNEYEAGAATTPGAALTLSGASTAITFAPSGRFEFVNGNFGGSVTTARMYGCDGVSKAFEFDGTVLVPIATGMTSDAPTHIAIHQNQLFLSFGASVQHSAPGDPYVWSAIVGAGEIAVGDNVSAFSIQPGAAQAGALVIITRNATFTLYGTGALDWNLVAFKNEVGGFPYTVQQVGGRTLVFDDRGICDLATSQNYGNFEDMVLSNRIKGDLSAKSSIASASCISRKRNQYRLFFTDGTGYYVTLTNGQVLGIMPVKFSESVRCAVSAEVSNGTEEMYFGSTDGYLYQMNAGTSLDGDAIEAYLYLAYNHSGSPRERKRYREVNFEASGEGYSEFNFSYELGYGTTLVIQPGTTNIPLSFAQTNWDTFYWDTDYWDGLPLLPSSADMTGTAENFSAVITSNLDYLYPHTITGFIFHYSQRRQLR